MAAVYVLLSQAAAEHWIAAWRTTSPMAQILQESTH